MPQWWGARASPYGCKLRQRSHGVSQPRMMGDGAAASGCNAELYVVGTHPEMVRRVALIERVELQACCARAGDDILAAGRLHAGRYPAPRNVRVAKWVVGSIVSARLGCHVLPAAFVVEQEGQRHAKPVELQVRCARAGDDNPAAGRLRAGLGPALRGVCMRLVHWKCRPDSCVCGRLCVSVSAC